MACGGTRMEARRGHCVHARSEPVDENETVGADGVYTKPAELDADRAVETTGNASAFFVAGHRSRLRFGHVFPVAKKPGKLRKISRRGRRSRRSRKYPRCQGWPRARRLHGTTQ